VHPGVERMLVSASSGEGLDALAKWLTAAAHARLQDAPER
jgi:hypothetical protein